MKLVRWSRSRWGLVLALLVDVALGGPRLPDLSSGPSLAAAIAAQESMTAEWMALEGVVGTAVGIDSHGDPVVTIYLTALGAARFPATVQGVPVQLRLTEPFRALGELPRTATDDIDRRGVFPRPVPIGVSSGHGGVTAGTLGARVVAGGRHFALGNNHVYANNNAGSPGDPLLQPGVADGGRAPDHTVATLHDFEPIAFCQGRLHCPWNRMDAAIAITTPDDVGSATPDDGYGTPRTTPVEATLGMAVQKYGRTTGLTRGRVTGINAVIDVSYRAGTARFEDQILISGDGFSAGGDSGSLIVSDGVLMADRRPVGLLFAGSPTSTIANPIGVVLDRFGVAIDDGRRP